MAHEDKQTYLNPDQINSQSEQSCKKVTEQLNDANKQIEDLKLQLAWLERPYE